jgi:hypothetical protein
MDSLFKPLHYREPALDSLSDGLTSYDPDISPNPTPQDRDISSIPAAQDSKLSSGPYDIQSLPQDHIWIGCTFQDIGEIDLSHCELRDLTYDWSSKEEFSNEGHLGWISQGSSFARVELERFPYMSSNEGFSSKRGLSDFSDMATPELSCSTMTPASSTMTPASSNTTSARSTMTTASSAVDSGYGGSEETRSELSKRQDRHRWPCQFCDKSYIRQGNLLLHERKKHNIHSETAKNIQQEAEARDDRTARSLQSTLGEVSLCKTSPLPHSKEKAHPSSKDEAKLMNYQGHDITDGSDDARVSKKREKPDDDASDCSGAFSSEEGDDSDGECDKITTWNCSQRGALPYFLPYTRGHDADTSSPYGDSPCGDSPDSESTTSGTTSDTPASSISGLTGGNSLQGNGYTPPSAETSFQNNGNSPVPGTRHGFGAKVADPQPLPLICWYPAAGIACNGKHVSSSSKIRYLWR